MATNASETALHLWRSKTVDAFARAELTVDVLVQKLNAPVKVNMISAKIDAVRKAKPNAAITEDRKKKIDQTLDDLTGLLCLRNDIVHAPMIIELIGESAVATFANPNLQCSFSSYKRTIHAPRLQALATKVLHLAKTLEGC